MYFRFNYNLFKSFYGQAFLERGFNGNLGGAGFDSRTKWNVMAILMLYLLTAKKLPQKFSKRKSRNYSVIRLAVSHIIDSVNHKKK